MNQYYMQNIVLTPEDGDLIYTFMDLDGSGSIDYEEFLRKLQRAGVFVKKKEEESLEDFYNKIKNTGHDIERVFEILDVNHEK